MYNNKTIAVFFQVRTESTRLPNKSLLKFDYSRNIFEQICYSLQQNKYIDNIIVSPPYSENNLLFKDWFTLHKNTNSDIKTNKLIFEMPEIDTANVLQRLKDVSDKYSYDYYVRITGDCPLICNFIIDKCIEKIIDEDLDYVDNTQSYTFPDGLDVSVYKKEVIGTINQLASKSYQKEHIGQYILENKLDFKVGELTIIDFLKLDSFKNRRLTVDTYKDYISLKKILNYKIDNIFDLLKIEIQNGFDCLENTDIIRDEGLLISKAAESLQQG